MADDVRPKYKDYLSLDEFWYSGIYEVAYYESREVGVQIRIRNNQKPPKMPKGLADKSIIRLAEWSKILKLCTRIVYA